MAFSKPNRSGLFDKYDITSFSNHLAELKPATWHPPEVVGNQRGLSRSLIGLLLG
jgi:hypothetical protein